MKKSKMQYQYPAGKWVEALPLGNGTFGAMVQAGVRQDKIGLNLDTLWSGHAKDKNNPSKHKDWSLVQDAIKREDYQVAEDYCKEHILGDWTECYLPAGDLLIERLGLEKEALPYQRQLDLSTGLHQQQFVQNEVTYHQECFVHFDKGVFCYRMYAEKDEKRVPISLQVELNAKLHHQTQVCLEEKSLVLKGVAPSYAAPNYFDAPNPVRYEQGKSMNYVLFLTVDSDGGSVKEREGSLIIEETSEVCLYLTGETSYRAKGDLHFICRERLKGLEYVSEKQDHVPLFQSIFDRVSLNLTCDESVQVPMNQRLPLQQRQNGLYELMFDYARYLLMSSSRPGTQAANLQGIWNDQIRAPWSANYTVNINTQMNYWIAEAANLSEFHLPLFDLMQRLAESGAHTAKTLYGKKGWVSHHNVDIWGHSSPVGYGSADANPCVYSLWQMSGGWLCRHLWEHYLYNGDVDFLRDRAFPIVSGAVAFYQDYLTEYQGYLATNPSTSPENMFLSGDGQAHALTIASTMDIAVLLELFRDYRQMRQVLEMEPDEAVEQVLAKLPPYQVGKNGQLQEWLRDYEEWDVNHRHVSHLYGLYPSNTIGYAREGNPENERLQEACRVSLTRREDEGTGWCMAWKACLWARLGDGDRALRLLNTQLRYTEEEAILMKGGGIYANLFCAHPPFQIDGNFGFAAAIIEMLMQSEIGKIRLLPALPKGWRSGSVKGLRAKGGYTVSFTWENGQITGLEVEASRAGDLSVEYNGEIHHLSFSGENLTYKSESQ